MNATAEEKRPGLVSFVLSELKPRPPYFTVFNVTTVLVMLVTAGILVLRFWKGLGAVTNLSQDYPWGIWIGFDVVTGVAFAGGAYVLTFVVYVLNVRKYHPIVRATVLNGFLAYMFYAGALVLDLGRPWHIVNPIIGNGFGVSSVLFLVAWHFLLYMMAQAVEFSPAVAEWLGTERARRILAGLTTGAVIFGITLSLLHQSGLGALFLMAKPKIHPLWYSEFIPILFVSSSVFAGISMVVLEGSITHKVFHHRVGSDLRANHDRILIGLSRAAAGAMFVYLALLALSFVHGHKAQYLKGGWGAWWALEIAMVVVPMVLYAAGARRRNLNFVKAASVLALLGIILDRLNISVIAFKWYAAVRYVPAWQEVVVTLGVISAELWAFRWVVERMPVLGPAQEEKTESAQVLPLHAVRRAG